MITSLMRTGYLSEVSQTPRPYALILPRMVLRTCRPRLEQLECRLVPDACVARAAGSGRAVAGGAGNRAWLGGSPPAVDQGADPPVVDGLDGAKLNIGEGWQCRGGRVLARLGWAARPGDEAIFTIGGAIGPAAAGALLGATGSYTPAITIITAGFAAAAGVLLLARPRGHTAARFPDAAGD